MIEVLFYLAATVAVFATTRAIIHLHIVHALLYFVISLMAVALILYLLGAPFIAALEVIIYAGAIMVLFIFVVMLLNQGAPQVEQERRWLPRRVWTGPGLLAAVLLGEVLYLLSQRPAGIDPALVGPREVGMALYGPYVLAVELGSLVLLAGIVGAFHLGRREREGR